jgi:uncharacterized membrane protein YdbT with pleckstrin-like domain
MLTALRKSISERYEVSNQRLIVEYGILNKRTEEIELYRVQDLSVERSLFDRMFGVGNIVIHSGDATGGALVLFDIADVENVKDQIRAASRVERQRHRVGVFEENWTEFSE